MRHSRVTPIVISMAMALAAVPQLAMAADSEEIVSMIPVYDGFIKNDVNGAVVISVPENSAATVVISFTSPEVEKEVYYSEVIMEPGTYSFDIEGRDNTEDDYRYYNLSVVLTGGKYNISTEEITEDFTVPDVDNNPDSFVELRYNFSIDGEYSKNEMEITEKSESEKDIVCHLDYLMQGDLNRDGEVSPIDASWALGEYTRLSTGTPSEFTDYQTFAADVDMNGEISPLDASRILKYYTALSTKADTDGIFVIPEADREEPEQPEEPTKDTIAAYPAYQSVMAKIKDASDSKLSLEECTELGIYEGYGYVTADNIGYMLRDINGDDKPELFVLTRHGYEGSAEMVNDIVEIYTITTAGEAIQVCQPATPNRKLYVFENDALSSVTREDNDKLTTAYFSFDGDAAQLIESISTGETREDGTMTSIYYKAGSGKSEVVDGYFVTAIREKYVFSELTFTALPE